MPLSDDQLNLVRQSFDALRQRLAPSSTFFYDDLFRRAPELRALFRDDLAGQGMKFMSTLSVLVDNLHKPEVLGEQYLELGTLHARLGINGAMFVPMRAALLATIKDGLGELWTIEIDAAWRTAFDDMTTALIDRGAIARA